ncbi:MAG: ATP-dependent Clp protease proteolytic subunit [Lachnospiraceae bacterium]|nr:ATP-dependent Clp protease proteolytic subunit [Lachnospiraceae bacterium]
MVINPIVYNDKRSSDVFSENLDKGIIHLVGEVTDEQAATVTAQLLFLNARMEEGENLIPQIYINSVGGSVSAGLAIYDTMKFIEKKHPIQTVCIGMAASMGAVILSGGSAGRRYILPHAEVMIHQPSGGTQGQSSDMVIAAEHIKDRRKVLNDILSANTGKGLSEIEKDTERDLWMNADTAVDYGIVDHVLR